MRNLLLVLLSAMLHALLFPPWEQAWLAWVALLPFLWVILRPAAGRLSFWWALAWGALWGHATHWPIASWVMDAVRVYFGQTGLFGFLFGMAASLLFWVPYYGLFAAGAAWSVRHHRGFTAATLVAAWWVACELARARVWVGSTWLLLGYGLVPSTPLMQAADLGGVYLLSFCVVLCNALLALGLDTLLTSPSARRPWRKPAAIQERPFLTDVEGAVHRGALPILAGLGVPLLLFAYGSWRVGTPIPDHPMVRVAVVQGNNEAGARWQSGSYGQGLDEYVRLSRAAVEGQAADVIVWPEAAVPVFLAREPQYVAQIVPLLRESGVELIAGAPHFDDTDAAAPRYFNSAFVLDATGLRPERYDKQHLMPFTEYYPWSTTRFLHRHFEAVRTFSPGTIYRELPTRFGRTAVVICFEADFPELVRQRMAAGAEMLVNLSNDVWLGSGRGQEQHLTMARLRSVENRTWMIRATTTGVSAVVDPFGRIVQRTRSDEAATLSATVTPLRIDTPYKRYGDLFAWLCVAVAAAGFLARGRPTSDRAAAMRAVLFSDCG